jgi:hypothetical protein
MPRPASIGRGHNSITSRAARNRVSRSALKSCSVPLYDPTAPAQLEEIDDLPRIQ